MEQWIRDLPLKSVVIMRGIPGSGKSTNALRIGETSGRLWYICSADEYFYDGLQYNFNPYELSTAHEKCLENFQRALDWGCPLIILDNTNILRQHYRAYEELARSSEYHINVVQIVDTDENLCFLRNVHGVPRIAINRMNRSLLREDDVRAYRVPMLPPTEVELGNLEEARPAQRQ